MARLCTIRTGVVVVAFVFGHSAGAAVVTYNQLTAQHSVSVRANVSDFPEPVVRTDSESSNALGTYFRTMGYDLTGRSTASGPPPRSTVAADQSVVFGDSIFGTIGASVRISGQPDAGGDADSQLETTFIVTEATVFALNGVLRMNADAPRAMGGFLVTFIFTGTGPGGETEQFESVTVAQGSQSGFGGSVTEPLTATGTLLPGWTYRLSTRTDVNAGLSRFYDSQQFVEGRVDFTLTVPEPAGTALAGVLAAVGLMRRRTPGSRL